MEFITLGNINLDTPDILKFYKDEEQPNKFFIIGQDICILEMKSIPNYIDIPYFRIEFLNIPKSKPTKKITDVNNMTTLYEKSNILNKQTLAIDPIFAAQFSDGNIAPQAYHICWPKKYIFKKNILAVVTNFGQCDIVEINDVTRTYENVLISLNDIFVEIFVDKIHENFKSLNEMVEDNVITTCCWMKTKENVLLFSTVSGWIFAAIINEETKSAKCISKIKTNLYKIKRLKSFKFVNNENEVCNGIIVSNVNGLINLYLYKDNEIKELCVLWDKHDKMSCTQFSIYYDKDNMELNIATIKGFHLLVFIVSIQTWSILYKGNEFCKSQISNLERLSKNEYIVSTLIGQTKLITLKRYDERYIFESSNIINDLEISNYVICGMAASQNKAAWIFIMLPAKKYMLNRQKFAPVLSFCLFNQFNPIEILNKYDRKKGDTRNFCDCYNVIHLQLLKNSTVNNLHLYNFEPIIIDWNFLHRLRIRYHIVNNIIKYNINKTKSSNENFENEIILIKLSIKAIFAYWRLLKMKNSFEELSDFQKLSAKCLRKSLISFLNKNVVNTPYINIKEILKNMSLELIQYWETTCINILEFCNFCGENTDKENAKCLHDIGRCCITEVQISNLEMKYCDDCSELAIDNEELLKQIQLDEYDLRCPLCDYILSS